MKRLLATLVIVFGMMLPAVAQDRSIIVASTTSTEQSGLFGYILPRFMAKTGIQVPPGYASAARLNCSGARGSTGARRNQ
jgi:tungstate transport system substrate-binding protein